MSGPNQKEHSTSGAKRAVIAALIGNTGVAIAKLIAAVVTGSSAMLAETLHSAADTFNQVFLLVGLRLGRRPPDEEHPFGYGRERYFWAFIVAISIFLLGAVFSINEGLSKIRHPHEIKHVEFSYAALAIAFLFETYALRIAWKEFQHWRESNPGPLFESLKRSKSPMILVVLFEDSAALLGIAAAAAGITLAIVTKNPVWDGVASLVIGGILALAAVFIGWRTRGLLIGEAATKADRQRIREAAESVEGVVSLLEVLTLHLGPEDILVCLNVDFRDDLDMEHLEAVIDKMETRIRAAVPTAKRIYVEVDSLRALGSDRPS